MTLGIPATGKRALLGKEIDLVNTPLLVYLIDSDFVFSLSNHSSVADIPDDNRLNEGALLEGKALVLNGDNVDFQADPCNIGVIEVEDTQQIGGIVVCVQAELYSNQTIIYFDDQADGLPATPDDEGVLINWGDGTGVIFTL